jgi:hypothetical protein
VKETEAKEINTKLLLLLCIFTKECIVFSVDILWFLFFVVLGFVSRVFTWSHSTSPFL